MPNETCGMPDDGGIPNDNCLAGLRCPNPDCGSYEPFVIEATTLFEVTDDGPESQYDIEWGDDSYIHCVMCSRMGVVRDFRIEEDENA